MTEIAEMYITNSADAKKCLGQMLYWDDVGSRYVFLRNGIADELFKGHLHFGDGDYKKIRDLPGLRNFKMGGAWARNKQASS